MSLSGFVSYDALLTPTSQGLVRILYLEPASQWRSWFSLYVARRSSCLPWWSVGVCSTMLATMTSRCPGVLGAQSLCVDNHVLEYSALEQLHKDHPQP